MRHADAPPKERACPGLKNCLLKQEGPDPCKGCKIRGNLSWQPQFATTSYAAFLADYIEAFRPPPDKITWYDFEIYRLFQIAKSEYERSNWEEKKYGHKKIHN